MVYKLGNNLLLGKNEVFFVYKQIKESSAVIRIPVENKISKKLPVFYNPVMKLNRDISILLLNSINKKDLRIALPLAGTGVRGIRFLLELKKNKLKQISFNDLNKRAVRLIKENLRLNKISNKKIVIKTKKTTKRTNKINISNKDANQFLLDTCGFDYIDIDPFGCPNDFLDSTVKRLSRDSILAVTATDTSALCGTYPKACLRKYWASPLKNELMHEIGLRILIRKAQLIGAQYEKALIPLFSYSHRHYMRAFFICRKSKKDVDEIIKQHAHFQNAGPLWVGPLWNKALVNRMCKLIKSKKTDKTKEKETNKELIKFLSTIKQESKINVVGFYNIHKIVKKYKIKNIPKKQELIKKIKSKGHMASDTHFNPVGIKSNISLKGLLKILRS